MAGLSDLTLLQEVGREFRGTDGKRDQLKVRGVRKLPENVVVPKCVFGSVVTGRPTLTAATAKAIATVNPIR